MKNKKGFQSPNHTQTPNDLFDIYLPELGFGELKVLLAIIRQTLGYHRKRSKLSLTFLEKATGLSRSAVQRACDKLESREFIRRKKTTTGQEWEIIWKDPPDMAVESVPVEGTLFDEDDESVPVEGIDCTRKRYNSVPVKGTKEIKKERIKEREEDSLDSIWSSVRYASKATSGVISPNSKVHTFIDATELVYLKDGVAIVKCLMPPESQQAEWMEDRMKSLIESSFVGVLARRIKVQFIGRDEQFKKE